MTNSSSLSEHERARAWRLAFTESLDELPDGEIAWEAQVWRRLRMPSLAQMCNDLLLERRACAFVFDGEATPRDLDLLWRRVPRDQAIALVRTEGCSLVTASRTVFWLRSSMRTIA